MNKNLHNALHKVAIDNLSAWLDDINRRIARYNEAVASYARNAPTDPTLLTQRYNQLIGEWRNLANEILEKGRRFGFNNLQGKVTLAHVPPNPENLRLETTLSTLSSRPITPPKNLPSQVGPISTNTGINWRPVAKGVAITTALGLASALAAMLAKKYFDKSKTQSPGQILDDQIPTPVVTKPVGGMSSYIPPVVPYIAG